MISKLSEVNSFYKKMNINRDASLHQRHLVRLDLSKTYRIDIALVLDFFSQQTKYVILYALCIYMILVNFELNC